jgi:hypothetical protein
MTKRYAILTAAILMLGMAGASAGELPSYDFAGFPVTPHQMSVLGQSGQMQEQAAAPTLLREGMPASPHQIAVLSRRSHTTANSARPYEAAETQIGPVTRTE